MSDLPTTPDRESLVKRLRGTAVQRIDAYEEAAAEIERLKGELETANALIDEIHKSEKSFVERAAAAEAQLETGRISFSEKCAQLDLAETNARNWGEQMCATNDRLMAAQDDLEQARESWKLAIDQRSEEVSRAAAAESKLDLARKALEEIDRQYENPDLGHEHFRVKAKVITHSALVQIAH